MTRLNFLLQSSMILLFILFASTALSAQQTVTITGDSFKDATILKDTRTGQEFRADTNYGTYPRNSATAWTNSGSNTFWRTLMYFDLSDIPTGSTIQTATLYLYSDPTYSGAVLAEGNSTYSGSNAFYLEKVVDEWDQTKVTWNNQPTTTTTDRIYLPSSTSTVENLQVSLTSIVQNWVTDPISNNGLKMTLENELHYRSRNYASSDHTNSAIRPKLMVTFTTPTTVVGCGTEDLSEQELMALPWYGNETFLVNFNDSVANAQNSQIAARVSGNIESPWRRVPINFYVYEISPTNPGGNGVLPNEKTLQDIMDALNNGCRNNGVNFRYYIQSVSYIDEESSLDMSGTTEAGQITARRGDKYAVNVHIVNNVKDPAIATTYNLFNAIFIERTIEPATFTHEMGHFFGLAHTFQYSDKTCFREPVTRGVKITPCPNGGLVNKRCLFTGDLLCDTDADPNMQTSGVYNSTTCTWDAKGKKDQNGDVYHPDALNYMAYANNTCRSHFSTGQKNIMHYWGLRILTNSSTWLPLDNNRFDRFEPDDAAVAARTILDGEQQSHTFHKQGRLDNQDWLKFSYPAIGSIYNFKITITQISSSAAGPLQFYLEDLTIKDHIGTNITSGVTSSVNGNQITYNIPCTLLKNGASYLVKIPRSSTGSTSDYDVEFRSDVVNPIIINGQSLICSNNAIYKIQNVPSGVSILWSITPNLRYISGQGTTEYTVAAGSSGAGTISAKLTGVCGSAPTITKDVTVSNGTAPTQLTIGRNECYDQRFSTDFNAGAVYTWTISGPGGPYVYPNSRYQLVTGLGGGSYSITVSSACPSSQPIGAGFTVDCSAGPKLVVSPNPATGVITVAPSSDNETKTALVANNLEGYEATLYDGTGVQILRSGSSVEGKLELDVKDLKKGLYVLHVKSSDGTTMHHILIE